MGTNDDGGPANVRRKRKNRKYNYGTSLPPPRRQNATAGRAPPRWGPKARKERRTHIHIIHRKNNSPPPGRQCAMTGPSAAAT